jgi:hypothetical protein
VIVPVYIPAGSNVAWVFNSTVTVEEHEAGIGPLEGVVRSHDWSEVAVKEIAPTERFCNV